MFTEAPLVSIIRRMRQASFLMTLFIALAPSMAAAKLPDGYGKARYGMTRAEVQKLYPEAVAVETRAGLELKTYGHVGNLRTVIWFAFTKGRLDTINVGFEPSDLTGNGRAQFAIVRDLLVSKYGRPDSVQEEATRAVAYWGFPEKGQNTLQIFWWHEGTGTEPTVVINYATADSWLRSAEDGRRRMKEQSGDL